MASMEAGLSPRGGGGARQAGGGAPPAHFRTRCRRAAYGRPLATLAPPPLPFVRPRRRPRGGPSPRALLEAAKGGVEGLGKRGTRFRSRSRRSPPPRTAAGRTVLSPARTGAPLRRSGRQVPCHDQEDTASASRAGRGATEPCRLDPRRGGPTGRPRPRPRAKQRPGASLRNPRRNPARTGGLSTPQPRCVQAAAERARRASTPPAPTSEERA